ncbi:Hypothetical_protein [Hexamita inflata]|uniref:Hypothetical_protein n=1 Tax=Hexamita inflata TaxID=28002 RepID=A0AA86Q5K3_9EUKA|nr:Hypothetical protein HINF_LOCUS34135 [Hexamita inflata]
MAENIIQDDNALMLQPSKTEKLESNISKNLSKDTQNIQTEKLAQQDKPKKEKNKGPKMPYILILQIIAKIAAIVSGCSCIIQYSLRIAFQAKLNSQFGFYDFQVFFISIVNIIIALILILSGALPPLSPKKQKFQKKLFVFCHPLLVGIIMLYLVIAQASPGIFDGGDAKLITEGVLVIINFVCCFIYFLFGLSRMCHKQSALNYYILVNKQVSDQYELLICQIL